MFGAVVNSQVSEIRIGECTILCENSVIRATDSGDVEHHHTDIILKNDEDNI
jgi:carbonic anhydrase/acetyltransferase-like protein (isoleucine patch superfamily)